MTKGRKPKPREVKIASGNPGRRKLPEPVLVGERVAGPPAAPAGLDERAAEVWAELAALLTEGGILTGGDLVALEGLAVMVGRARQARAALEGEPLVVRGSQSWMIPNPLLRIERDAWAAAQRVAVEFGMTPSARARLGLTMVQGRSLGLDLARKLDEAAESVPATVTVPASSPPAPRRRATARDGDRSS